MPNLTIKDIARLSGCSVSTISRVINDRPDVRPETKEKVLQVMRESGFVPNTNARQLKIQQSRSLVFVVKGTRNSYGIGPCRLIGEIKEVIKNAILDGEIPNDYEAARALMERLAAEKGLKAR